VDTFGKWRWLIDSYLDEAATSDDARGFRVMLFSQLSEQKSAPREYLASPNLPVGLAVLP
jgi:hypothetical protein